MEHAPNVDVIMPPSSLANMKRAPVPHPYRDFEFAGWERAAAAYADTFESATRLFADPLLDAVDLNPGANLLDNACGSGYVTQLAFERGAAVTGADFSAAMLAEARRLHPLVRFEQADAEALPYADQSFDAVVINFGVHHFPFPEQALMEARRVLRSSGRVAFTVWAAPDQHALYGIALEAVRNAGDIGVSLPTPPHGGINTIEACIALLSRAGFLPITELCRLERRTLRLRSVAELTHLIESGTVRLASLLRSQSRAKRAAILRCLETAANRYQRDGNLEIPVVAVLVAATPGTVRNA